MPFPLDIFFDLTYNSKALSGRDAVPLLDKTQYADVAQLVEHILGKDIQGRL
jgi:hypothetical protein